MKEKMIRLATTILGTAKNPMGLTVAGAMAGSVATYLFNKTKLAQDLERSQDDNKALRARVLSLEGENGDHQSRNNKLIDELRQTDRALSSARINLSDSERDNSVITASLANSWCFWRAQIYQRRMIVAANPDNPLATSPVLRK